jgi:hypothetical protein
MRSITRRRVGGGLWLSYLFVLFYLAIAAAISRQMLLAHKMLISRECRTMPHCHEA